MSSQAEDIIRETFSGLANILGVKIDAPDEMIANLGAVLQAQIDLLAELQSIGRLIPAGGMALTAEEWANRITLADKQVAVSEAWEQGFEYGSGHKYGAEDGGVRLTAEQVEDVRIVLGLNGSQDIKVVLDAQARLRALFPATEPAEEVKPVHPRPNVGDWGYGGGAAVYAPEVRCKTREELLSEKVEQLQAQVRHLSRVAANAAEHGIPAPAEPAEEETKAEEAEICGEFIRLRSRPNICTQPKGHGDDHFNPADLTPFGPVRAGKAYPYADGDHTVLGPEIFTDGYAISWKGEAYVKASTPSSVKELVEAIRFTVEYVGLETLPPIEGWSWYDELLKYAPENAKVFLDAYVPPVNPSPVVPALTETGPWQDWPSLDAIPADVRTVWDKAGDEYRRTNGGWKFRSPGGKWQQITLPLDDYIDYAPFTTAPVAVWDPELGTRNDWTLNEGADK